MKFDTVYAFRIGDELVHFGKLAKPEASAPQVYAAALSEHDLHRYKCGFGATEAEAAADLFRLIRAL